MFAVVNVVKSYPYFFSNIMTLPVFLVAIKLSLPCDHRRITILSGLLQATAVPLMIPFHIEYWHPSRLEGWTLGIEDVTCSFIVAGSAWLLAVWPYRNSVIVEIRPRIFLLRHCYLMGISAPIFLLSWASGMTVMSSLLLTYAVLFLLLVRRKDMWRLAICGSLTFSTLYLLIVRMFYSIWPGFVLQWNGDIYWGSTVWGVPLGEIVWAVSFGLTAPLIVAYLFDAQLIKHHRLGLFDGVLTTKSHAKKLISLKTNNGIGIFYE